MVGRQPGVNGEGHDTVKLAVATDGTKFAKIRFAVNGTEAQLDCRPSDAVAVAVRVGAPIFVSEGVLDEAGIPTEDEDELAPVEASSDESAEEPEEESPKSPLQKLEDDLAKTIADEDYERAAKLRDDIMRLKSEQN